MERATDRKGEGGDKNLLISIHAGFSVNVKEYLYSHVNASEIHKHGFQRCQDHERFPQSYIESQNFFFLK